MPSSIVEQHDRARDEGLVEIRLNRPGARNALSIAMFDALDATLQNIATAAPSPAVLLLHGAGPAFSGGFDLAAAIEQPALMAAYVHRLSRVNRTLRRLPCVVVAAVQGAAIAGGCALLGPCDFVFVDATARLGYPAHRLGISPAVTIPTLRTSVGDAGARELLLGGELIDGRRAMARGIASHLFDPETARLHGIAVPVGFDAGETPGSTDGDSPGRPDEPAVVTAARAWCRRVLLRHGHRALRETRAWLNALDGSDQDAPFDRSAGGSAALCDGEEAVTMLQTYWARLNRSGTGGKG